MNNKNTMSLLSKYAAYFHDGAVRDIQHEGDNIIISMESAEIERDWYWDRMHFPLSKRATITGKLHLEGIQSIKEDDHEFSETLKMMLSHGQVYDMEIKGNKLTILITWEQYVPTKISTDVFTIEIEAKKIYWEHLPTAFDKYWDSQ